VAQATIKNVAKSAAIKRKEEFILVNDSVLAFGLRLTSDGGGELRKPGAERRPSHLLGADFRFNFVAHLRGVVNKNAVL
jgi:hypothetical protein